MSNKHWVHHCFSARHAACILWCVFLILLLPSPTPISTKASGIPQCSALPVRAAYTDGIWQRTGTATGGASCVDLLLVVALSKPRHRTSWHYVLPLQVSNELDQVKIFDMIEQSLQNEGMLEFASAAGGKVDDDDQSTSSGEMVDFTRTVRFTGVGMLQRQ